MPRPRKFQYGDVVLDNYLYEDDLAVVVDYRQDRQGRGFYRIIRLTHLPGGTLYGRPAWRESRWLTNADASYTRARSVYLANKRIGTAADRGCSCNCCPHTAIPLSDVLGDGSFRWENE